MSIRFTSLSHTGTLTGSNAAYDALLAGFRGAKPVALDALSEAIARLSELAWDQRERLAELDVNPILANAERVVALDALALIAACGVNQ